MLQGIGHLAGVMKETMPDEKKKKKKNKFKEALSKFSMKKGMKESF